MPLGTGSLIPPSAVTGDSENQMGRPRRFLDRIHLKVLSFPAAFGPASKPHREHEPPCKKKEGGDPGANPGAEAAGNPVRNEKDRS